MPMTLIEKLEAATGRDRAINAEIYFTLDPEVRDGWHAPNGIGPERHYARVSPDYTGSIDAAMKLFPEGAGLRLDRYWLSDREAWTAVASTGGIPSNPAKQFVAEDAHTPAIALCIVGIKSRG